MAYEPTTWSNGYTKLNADNMNHIENGIETIDTNIGDLTDLDTSVITNLVSAINSVPEIIVDGDKTSIKYPSGLMINTIKANYSNVSVSSAWGGIYASSAYAIGDYKTPFVSLFSVNVTCKSGGGNHWCMETEDSVDMLTTSPKVAFLRGTSGQATGTLYVTAIGTWK